MEEPLSQSVGSRLLARCQEAAGEVSQALSAAWGESWQLSAAEIIPPGATDLLAEISGPGLVFQFDMGDRTALLLLSNSNGSLPPWYAQPSDAETRRLTELGQVIGRLLLPPDQPAQDCMAIAEDDLRTILEFSGAHVQRIRLSLRSTVGMLPAVLVFPLAAVAASETVKPAAGASAPATTGKDKECAAREADLEALPPYGRSLLRVKVPVMVTLATKKHPVHEIVELVPGAILQFAKSCDETLELEVGTQRVAQGECVKVGDKFGLRITSFILPSERFCSVGTAQR